MPPYLNGRRQRAEAVGKSAPSRQRIPEVNAEVRLKRLPIEGADNLSHAPGFRDTNAVFGEEFDDRYIEPELEKFSCLGNNLQILPPNRSKDLTLAGSSSAKAGRHAPGPAFYLE